MITVSKYFQKTKAQLEGVEDLIDFLDGLFEEGQFFIFVDGIRTKDSFELIYQKGNVSVWKANKWNYIIIDGLTPSERQKIYRYKKNQTYNLQAE